MIVRDGQSLKDICLQEYGSYDGMADLISRNAIITSIDFEPEAGMELVIGEPINAERVNYFKSKNLKLVTNNEAPEEGVDNGVFSEEFNEVFG